MTKMIVNKINDIIVLTLDNSNTHEEFNKYIDDYVDTLRRYTTSSEVVIFDIQDLDADGWWLNLSNIWLYHRNNVQIVCEDEDVYTTIVDAYDTRATFYRSLDDALRRIK